jgi:hypothetical protein
LSIDRDLGKLDHRIVTNKGGREPSLGERIIHYIGCLSRKLVSVEFLEVFFVCLGGVYVD